MTDPDDPVYLYRRSISTQGELIARAELSAGAERQSIAHFLTDVGSADPNGPIPQPRSVEVYLLR